jgi:hypothetical protein
MLASENGCRKTTIRVLVIAAAMVVFLCAG